MRLLFTCLLALLSFSFARAANEGRALSARVAAAHAQGLSFEPFSLMNRTSAPAHKEILTHETLFRPDAASVTRLYETHPSAISLKFRTDEGKEYELELLESHPLSSKVRFGKIDESGRHEVTTFDPGVHYQGSVVGSDQSLAALSVFADGKVMLLFANEEGNFVMGQLEDGSGNYILYNDMDMLNRPNSPCATKDEGGDEFIPASTAKQTKALLCNKVEIYWEVTNNMYVAKGSTYLGTQTYMTGLFNQFQTMYANEKIAVELKTLYIWVTADDMPTTSSTGGLDWILGSWTALGNTFDGDLAHVITKTGKGNGGLAYVDVLCNRSAAFAYSDINGAYSAVPTFSWDVEVITHETGHNLGSKHTHWCGWMTGAGGTCGSIDNCTTQEAITGCTTCGATNLNSDPPTAWKGTVMSYCHLVTRGISLANGFGTLPGNKIRTEVSGAACLNTLISAELFDTSICGGVGSITLNFKSDNFGTAPYTYNWSNNLHTQNLKNLTTPGNYSVQIIDSNGCQASYGVDLIRRPTPGTSLVPSPKMPICCLNNGQLLSLNATAPQDLTSCQTVYWLRSTTQPTTFAIAKAIFDTTQAVNIVASTNQSSINASTGAQLTIQPPTSCSTKSTWYYTPMVVNLPRVAHTITATSTGATNIQRMSTNLGKSTNLPDETAVPTACDLLDTPSQQTISVTVSGYTGRSGKLRLALTDASGRVIYEAFGLAGNGTYIIHQYDMTGDILQAIKVSAFDYNCTSSTCVASSCTISAVRNVVYPAHGVSANPGCTIGAAIKVEFAPTACTKLDASNLANGPSEARIHPNPASHEAYLEYQIEGKELVQVRVVDLLGRAVWQQSENQSAGAHRISIPVGQWAKGVYSVQLQAGNAEKQSLRLVVE